MAKPFSERRLEDIVFENREVAHERGFTFPYRNTFKQYYLPSGKKMDMFSFAIERDVLFIKIIEFKRDALKIGAIFQVQDYFIEIATLCAPHFRHIHPELILVGARLDKQVLSLYDLGIRIDFYLYRYEYDGLVFKYLEDRKTSYISQNSKQLPPTEQTTLFSQQIANIDSSQLLLDSASEENFFGPII